VGQAAAPSDRYTITGGVAIVPVRGVLTANAMRLERILGWTTYLGLEQTCASLAQDPSVRGVVLEMNTAGGMVLGIDAAVQAIAALTRAKPVHALVDPMAASAGYWLASQATEISMTQGAIVGSIGIAQKLSASVGSGLMGEQGFEFTSSQARAKRPDPTTDEGRAEIARALDVYEANFHAAVAAGRKIDPSALSARLSVTDDPRDGGATFLAAEAIERGLADRAETRSAFVARVMGLYAPKGRVGAQGYRARALAAQAAAQL
jgi:ClpP class serine protease